MGINYFDQTVMKGVNAGVYAFNWVFGGTKEDLSNLLHISVPMIRIVGSFGDGISQGICGLVMFPIVEGSLSYIGIKFNGKQMKLEESAREKHCLDQTVELIYKPTNKGFAMVATVGAGIFDGYCLGIARSNHTKDIVNHYSDLVGGAVRGLACLTICGDYLPPRKNVFSRTADRLKEWHKEQSERMRPSDIPLPSPFG